MEKVKELLKKYWQTLIILGLIADKICAKTGTPLDDQILQFIRDIIGIIVGT